MRDIHISDYKTLKDLYLEAKRKGLKYTNFYMMLRDLQPKLKDKKISYFYDDKCLILLVDNILFTDIFYFRNDEDYFIEIKENKPLCISEGSKELFSNKSKFSKWGYLLESINKQIVMDLRNNERDIKQKYNELYLKYSADGYVLRKVISEKEAENVKKIWLEGLKITDIPADHYNFLNDDEMNVIAIFDGDIICSVIWFSEKNGVSEGRHTTTNPDYYHRGLGTFMTYAWLYRSLIDGCTIAKGWIEDSNTKSKEMHRKIGFVENGFISRQYIKDGI